MRQVKPWAAGSVCPEQDYPDFANALKQASHHFADDSGREWGEAHTHMKRAAEIAASASWPYWTMKRMYGEIAPLPNFDAFMEVYCRHILVDKGAA